MTPASNSGPKAWLVRRDGLHAGIRYPLSGLLVRIGREPRSEVSVRGATAGFVSSRHAEVRIDGGRFMLHDLGSTNGTLVNGLAIEQAELEHGAVIELGKDGPQFMVELASGAAGIPSEAAPPARSAVGSPPPVLGRGTAQIMRRAVQLAQQSAKQRWRRTVWMVSLALAAVTIYAGVATWRLHREKGDIGRQITAIESRLAGGAGDAREVRRLLEELERYQRIALRLEESALYELTQVDRDQLYVERELRELLLEFGAEQTIAPPDFSARVLHYIRQYQGSDRATMQRALTRARDRFDQIRRQFEEAHLPPDLAYVVLVESALVNNRESGRGAMGLWQLLPGTARQYGLQVDADLDERLDPKLATEAAARHIRALILDFGSGSSVLLALAAYNGGATRVRRAVQRVEDPIAQRNFWYLYASQTLPAETREYVPKILAAIVIGRNPERFGF